MIFVQAYTFLPVRMLFRILKSKCTRRELILFLGDFGVSHKYFSESKRVFVL